MPASRQTKDRVTLTSVPPGSRIRVALIDDHPIFGEGLKRLLEAHPELEVVGEGVDGEEALRIVREMHPDVLLLDFAMPGRDGVDTLSDLPPGAARVILLTAAIGAEDILLAVQRGARGVVSKESPAQFLIDGIHRVMEGKYVIGSAVFDDFAEVLSHLAAAPPRPYGLTPRELEIATAVADGEGNREVARRLSISPQTVKHHLTRIFDKTGVSTRLELALFVIEHGLTKRGGQPTPR